MSIGGILLGIINIGIVVALLLLVGVIALWIMGLLGMALPDEVRKLYIAIVALIALYLIVALLFGLPGIRVLPMSRVGLPIGVWLERAACATTPASRQPRSPSPAGQRRQRGRGRWDRSSSRRAK